MVSRDNLLIELHRWAHRQDENFTTEAFAHLLKELIKDIPEEIDSLMHTLTGVDLQQGSWAGAVVDTQVHTKHGTPDVSICLPELTIYIEVKVEAELTDGQAEGYLSALEELAECKDTKLALLTKYPAPASVSIDVHRARWFEIIDELEKLELQNLSDISSYLIVQSKDFLTAKGMAIPKIRSGISAGVRDYLRSVGDDSLFTTEIYRVPSRLLDEEQLVPLHDLLSLMAVAIEESGVSTKNVRFGSGRTEGAGWVGWNIDALRCFFYIRVSEPEIVIYQTFDVNPSMHDGISGRLYEDGNKWTWDVELDLASSELHFFDLDKSNQIQLLSEFVSKSNSIANSLK